MKLTLQTLVCQDKSENLSICNKFDNTSLFRTIAQNLNPPALSKLTDVACKRAIWLHPVI